MTPADRLREKAKDLRAAAAQGDICAGWLVEVAVLLDLLADAWEALGEDVALCGEPECETCPSRLALLARIEEIA